MEPRAQFAANLRRERARLGISQEELGSRSSMHRTEVGLLERERRDPRLATIVKLARALGISPAQLLRGVE